MKKILALLKGKFAQNAGWLIGAKVYQLVINLVISMLMMQAAEKRGLGIRVEVLLALCVILPQGFMNAAASALTDVTAAALLFICTPLPT